MKIGDIDLGEKPVVLAPMEDVTDAPFRQLCREMGAAAGYTEFVSADALVRNIDATTRKLRLDDERPTAIQLYGRETVPMVEAALLAQEASPDFIDINFGCPVKKVAGKGAGAGMLRNVPKMLEITKAIVKAVKLPVTVKTRLGWDHESKIIVELSEQLQDCGIAALTVHGRTRSQIYTGTADWEMIARVKANPRLHIPVIGNGDICNGEQADRAFRESGVDAIMVGRASIGAPWIFREITDYLGGKDCILSTAEKMAIMRRLVHESVERLGEIRGILHIRRHLAATPLFKGIADFRSTRIAMLRAATIEELDMILDNISHNYLKL
ncbi:MAG: tRNA dihydrouridine synthase DusB [Odoribacter sp.]|nr:tRNA dihydrouridine synthase DusB [Odoribacter sp.]